MIPKLTASLHPDLQMTKTCVYRKRGEPWRNTAGICGCECVCVCLWSILWRIYGKWYQLQIIMKSVWTEMSEKMSRVKEILQIQKTQVFAWPDVKTNDPRFQTDDTLRCTVLRSSWNHETIPTELRKGSAKMQQATDDKNIKWDIQAKCINISIRAN